MPVLALTVAPTATTAIDLITDALIEIGVLGAGQTPAAEDAALGLRYLNRLVQKWSNTPLMMPVVTQVSVSLTGAASYTIGPTGDVVTTRPLSVVDAYAVDSGGLRWGVRVYGRQEWNAVGDPNTSGGPPSIVYYERSTTNGRVYVYPRSTGYTLQLDCLSLIGSFDLATTVGLPDGYESAIVLSLAEELTGPYTRPASMDLKVRAKGARAAIKRTNLDPLMLSQPLAEGEDFQIERGY